MSFINNKNERIPCPINGNPLNGMSEKVCITVDRVFDACMSQNTYENLTLVLTDVTPTTVTPPLTFISCKSSSSTGTLTGLTIDPLSDRPGCSRVRASVTVPVEVVFVDHAGVEGMGNATITLPLDVVMAVPSASIIPSEIDCVVGCVAPQGSFVSGTTFTVTACITVILKCVAKVDLLVPSYGYCFIPPCQNFTEDVCTGFFELPLFPNCTGANCRNT
ncbi:MAG: hypothetical protein ACI4S9_06595 [Christensenellales bacterium]